MFDAIMYTVLIINLIIVAGMWAWYVIEKFSFERMVVEFVKGLKHG